MPSDVETLALIRSQTLQLIADLTAMPKPSYRLDGQEVSWESYLGRLQATLKWCDERLASAEPFEIHSQGIT